MVGTKKLNKLYVITDENVDALYKDYFSILSNKIVGKYVIKAGEENKNIDTVMKIYNKLLSENIDRKCAIVAFGGGVVGDLTGFVAATFKRGTKFVQVPTTIVSQTDSSIGGKNGFNYEGIKNIIGTFYQPDLVYVDVNLLKTLDYKYFKDGMAEVIKYAYSLDANLFRFLEENKKAIKEREIDKLKHIVTECAKLKASIVEKDVFDEGLRHLLNFGHTVGHAIETTSNFSVGHGEAVAMGMVYETYIAYKRNYIDYNKLERLINLIEYFELPIEYNIDNYKQFENV